MEVTKHSNTTEEVIKASRLGDGKTVWKGIVSGIEPSLVDEKTGLSLLHNAAKYDDLGLCQLLVSKGADVNARDKSLKTPLHTAAYWGRINVVEFLIYVHANIHYIDSNNRTAEEVAFDRNNTDVYKLLLLTRINKQTKRKVVLKQFKELIKEQEKEQKLLKRERKLEKKMSLVSTDLTKFKSVPEEDLSTQKTQLKKVYEEKLAKMQTDYRQNSIKLSMLRSNTFQKYQEAAKKSFISIIDGIQ